MRYGPIDPNLFRLNRDRLKKLLPPGSLAVLHGNDLQPTNADGSFRFRQNSDLFYLTGVDQEETILLLCPDAADESLREILFLRETNDQIAIWEGRKLTQDEARRATGIRTVKWLSEFRPLFHRLTCESEHIWLNSNEHPRADIAVETRSARFIRRTKAVYPLHNYRRLAPLLHTLRPVKSPEEIRLLRAACDITAAGFHRVARYLKPGVTETELEAEFAHEFIRRGGDFAYAPIIAGGPNACVLHYVANDQVCRAGDLLLLDVAASYANYNSDLTRTLPVSGKFTRRQKQVYAAVLRVLRQSIQGLVAGRLLKDWQREAEQLIQVELLGLDLLTPRQIKAQDPGRPALKKYFMHGVGHPLGLDVHDVSPVAQPLQAGWVMTVEPAIYIPEEGLGIRLENDVLVTETGPVDLMAHIPIEIADIEKLMAGKKV
jgi:Xaa-Pro aminopeptidase